MFKELQDLPQNKKIFFASDMHLGAPNKTISMEREKKLVRWLDQIQSEAHAIFFLGDIFDFWFEYKYVIPKGFVRLFGKLADLTDKGTFIYFFTGNHDMWMYDYFPNELNITVFKEPQILHINNKKLFVGHGDGLGSGDPGYKILKKIFRNSLCQWAFAWLHPNLGIRIANYWSKKSRAGNLNGENVFLGEKEWLLNFCKETEKNSHHDFYIFGHRHFPLEVIIDETCEYYNLGEWVNYFTYGEFDGKEFNLVRFEKD